MADTRRPGARGGSRRGVAVAQILEAGERNLHAALGGAGAWAKMSRIKSVTIEPTRRPGSLPLVSGYRAQARRRRDQVCLSCDTARSRARLTSAAEIGARGVPPTWSNREICDRRFGARGARQLLPLVERIGDGPGSITIGASAQRT